MILERFRREARAAARLHHTNIVPVYEVGHDGDVRFYAMQFIQGQGLDAVITELLRLRDRTGLEPKVKAASEDLSLRSRGEHSRQGIEAPTLGEGEEVSPVLRSILTGRFDPGGRSPGLVGASPSMLARALAGGLGTPTGSGTASHRAESDLTQASTETESATAGDANRPKETDPTEPELPSSASRRQARRSCPEVPSSRRPSRAGVGSSAAWRRSAGRSPGAWLTPMRGGSCTGTSSRRTCSWTPKAWSG